MRSAGALVSCSGHGGRAGFVACVVLAALPGRASADPAPLEVTGFFGVTRFGDQIALGSAMEPEQRPQTAPVFGGTITYLPFPALGPPGGLHLALGVEASLSLTTSWTGYGYADARPSYFAPVLGMRVAALVGVGGVGPARLHVSGGLGGATVVSGSPYLQDETDRVLFWGPGATFAVAPRWRLRVDLHQGFLPAQGGGLTSTYDVQVGLGMTFGGTPRPVVGHGHVEVAGAATPPPAGPQPVGPVIEYDTDGDGIPDSRDACPTVPESHNGIDDADGCPEPDPDGDGLVGTADRCPDQPEDFDKFQDDDGCPDPDNDGDGVPDTNDACPTKPETRNGFEDQDGCPDQLPANLVAALQDASRVRFEAGRPRMTAADKDALRQVRGLLRTHPAMRVRITVHPDAAGDAGTTLANRRAGVVKYYFIDQGAADDQLETEVGTVAAQGPILEITIAPPATPAP